MDTAAVVGLGKIGLPFAVLCATHGWRVWGCDTNPDIVEKVNRGVSPVVGEPGLEESLSAVVRSGSLRAATDTSAAVRESDVVVILVPLLVDQWGAVNYSHLDEASGAIADGLSPGTLVVCETTLPVGATRKRVGPALEKGGLRMGVDFHLAFSPERVSSGRVFRDLRSYPKIVGGVNEESTRAAVAFYSRILEVEVIAVRDSETAEFAKLIETTYRDVNIALANEFALFAHDRGLDAWEAIRAANSQPYSHVHSPGLGVGGHCIPVYPHLLMSEYAGFRIPQLARAINAEMPRRALEGLRQHIGGFSGKTILVLGLAYRGGVREKAFSPSLSLVSLLKGEGGRVLLNDPLFSDAEIRDVGAEPLSLDGDVHVDAVILACDHPQYRELDFQRFRGCKALLDGRGFLDPASVERAGVKYLRVGWGI